MQDIRNRLASTLERLGAPIVPSEECVISERETAALLGISLATMQRLRKSRKGPPVTYLSERRLGYKLGHVYQYRDACTKAGRP
jgi:hypothetical protein